MGPTAPASVVRANTHPALLARRQNKPARAYQDAPPPPGASNFRPLHRRHTLPSMALSPTGTHQADLARELARVAACPYPASLSKLGHILARSDGLTIRACLHDLPPCAVKKLSTAVSDALPLWAYAVRMLHSLCHSLQFRDEVLLQNPGLLNALLTKANSSQRDFEEYGELCVLLLSNALPEAIPLPASGQKFFLRAFQRAIDAPGAGSLRYIHCMLDGACKELLNLLPPKVKHDFDSDLRHMLSTSNSAQNSMLFLRCVGVSILADHTRHGGWSTFDSSTPASTPEKRWKTPAGSKLFGPDQSSKTINLTLLHVNLVIKEDNGFSDTDVQEGISIANRALLCIDRSVRETWPTTSRNAHLALSRLPPKIMREGINPAIQLEAMCFYALIAGSNNLPDDLVQLFEVALLNMASYVHTDTLQESLSIALPLFAPRISDTTVQTLFCQILEACISGAHSRHLAEFVSLVEVVSALLPTCDTLRSQILHASSSSTIQPRLQRFLDVGPGAQADDGLCATFTTSLQRSLQSNMVSMLLISALSANTADTSMPQALVIALIRKQQQLPSATTKCNHSITPPLQRSISLFEEKCTPSAGEHLRDWKERLRSELDSQNSFQRESIVRAMAQICQDLEVRCETAEEPLRQEQSKAKELAARVATLQEEIAKLNSEAVDREMYMDGLQAENESFERARDEAVADVDQLRMDLEEANAHADETLRTVRESFNKKELELRSALSDHEERISAREEEIQELMASKSLLTSQLEQMKGELVSLADLHQDQRSKLDRAENDLDNERGVVVNQASKLESLEDQKTTLENRLHAQEAEIKTTTAQLNELQARHQELVRSSEEALLELEAKYDRDMEETARRTEAEHRQLDDELKEALRKSGELADAYKETHRELGVLQVTVPGLEARIEELMDLCTEKDEELCELRNLRSKVLASVGLASMPVQTHSTTSYGQVDPKTPRLHRRPRSVLQQQEEPVPGAATSTQGISHAAMESLANTSFVSSDSQVSQSSQRERTSKRTKTRSSFKEPAMHTPYKKSPIPSSGMPNKRVTPTKRNALGQLSPNRWHTTVGIAGPAMRNDDECEHEYDNDAVVGTKRRSMQSFDQTDLELDDLLGSTPFTPGNFMTGTGRAPDEEDDMTFTEL